MLRIALLTALLVGAIAAPAVACPPGPCNKYRRPPAPDVITIEAVAYVRQHGSRLPRFTRSAIARFLADSAWEPIMSMPATAIGPHTQVISPPWLRFAEARSVTRTRSTMRTVLLRRIDIRRGTAMIEVDGAVFVLERCADMPRRVCLTKRTDLSFDDPIDDTDFARPPG